MPQYQTIKDSIEKHLSSSDPYQYADEIMDAYHELDKMDSSELTSLKTEYLMGRLDGPIKGIFEDHLLFCSKCLKEMENIKDLIWATKTYGEEFLTELSLEKQTSTIKTIKDLAKTFIQKYFPGELSKFDLAWRVFNDVDFDELDKDQAFAGALAATGKSDLQESVLPDVILCLANSFKNIDLDSNKLDAENILNNIDSAAQKMKLSKELTDQLSDFVKERI